MAKLKYPLNPAKLVDLLFNQKREIETGMNCVNIGIIQEFNSTEQTVHIKLALKKITNIEPDGTRIYAEHPLLLRCPVVVLYGGVGYMTMPITAGDECLVVFNDREIDNWFTDGGVVAPTSLRTHDFSDAFAIVGIRSLQNSIAAYLTNGIRLSYNGTAKIDILDDQIESVAALFFHTGNVQIDGDMVVNGDVQVNGNLRTTVGADTVHYNNHVHSGVDAGPDNSGGPVPE